MNTPCANDTEISVPGRRVEVSSTWPRYSLRLDKEFYVGVVPKGMDVVGVRLSHVPPELEAVEFVIGHGAARIRLEGEDLEGIVAGVPVDVFLTKCSYHVAHFEFVFSDAYIKEHQEAEEVDETRLVPVFGDDVDVWDDRDECARTTREILGYEDEKTGRRVLHVTRDADVDVPEVTFRVRPPPEDGSDMTEVWQYFDYVPGRFESLVDSKNWDFKVQKADGTSFEAAVASGEPFRVRIRNVVRYSGMASMRWAV